MTNETRLIEVKGVKMEIDLRHATRLDTFRVGDKVKILKKNYSSHNVYPGVIAGFENFEKLPTIIVAYITGGYDSKLDFEFINSESETELVKADDNHLPIEKAETLRQMDKAIEGARSKVSDLEARRKYFVENFHKYFNLGEEEK